MQGPTIGPEDLPPNLVRKCVRCDDFTAQMTSVVTETQRRTGAGHQPIGPNQVVRRDYHFTCTKCGAQFSVPGAETLMTFGGLAIVGLVILGAALSQGLWMIAPVGLLFGAPLAWGVYQRKKHPGMF